MLYTRLAECIDKSAVVVTRLAVHVMISHNCLCIIYSATSPWCFFLNKWKCCEMKHKFDYKTQKKRYNIKDNSPYRDSNPDHSIVIQRATNELQRQSVRLLLRAVMNRHIYTYLYIYFSTPASRVYSHCVIDYILVTLTVIHLHHILLYYLYERLRFDNPY